MKNAYERVEALRLKHPNTATRELCAKAKVSTAAYYAARRPTKTRRKKPVQSSDYAKIPLPVTEGQRLMVIMGSPDQIREVLK